MCSSEYNLFPPILKGVKGMIPATSHLLMVCDVLPKARAKEGAVKFGTLDDKGSSYLEIDGYIAGNVSKVSMSLDQEKGVEYLEKKGLGDLIDVETVKTINEERLEKAVGDKRLTLKEVESFTNKKQTYQVSVKAVYRLLNRCFNRFRCYLIYCF